VNPFTHPELFKIDLLSHKRSAAGAAGGKVRARNANGEAVPGLKTKNSEKYKDNHAKKK
jgi:hypothetical protein